VFAIGNEATRSVVLRVLVRLRLVRSGR